MNDFCKDKTWAFVMDDSTRNREIYNWDYVRYSENLFNYDRSGNPVKFLLDSSWLPFLKNVNTKMRMLKKTRIPEFKSIAKVHILNKDTISSLKEQFTVGSGFYKNIGWMKGRLEFSDIILSDKKNMAIVEFSETCGSLCGAGMLYFLQRDRNGKWKVVYTIQTWVS